MPIILRTLRPSSVVDVGCGNGAWLSTFAELGIADLHGVDDPWRPDLGEIPYTQHDLASPLDLGRRFDLVVSLEVGEHLPEDTADTFVQSLTRHSDTVLFSAAIPWQSGPGHVNLQWQSWWAEKFASHGYQPVDLVRPAVWDDQRVSYWYRQNMLVYILEGNSDRAQQIDIVHPELFDLRRRDYQLFRVLAYQAKELALKRLRRGT